MAKKRKGVTAPKETPATKLTGEEDSKRKSAALAARWLKAIDRRREAEKTWRERGKAVVKRFRDERESRETTNSRFNILWANTETLKPAIFSRLPIPDVRRRNNQKDPVGRTAALIMQRALAYCIEQPSFLDTLIRVEEDYLLPGRGFARVKYEPTIERTEKRVAIDPLPDDDDEDEDVSDEETLRETLAREADGAGLKRPARYPEGTQFDTQGAYRTETAEQMVYQEVYACYNDWRYVVFDNKGQWDQVTWVAYGSPMTKQEVKRNSRYKEFAEKLSYDLEPEDVKEPEEHEKQCLIWEVYHKISRKLIVVAQNFEESPLFVQDDALQLEHCFPSPEPMYSIRNNGSWEPVPEFYLYQDQANELDEVSYRIRVLTAALKNRGVYDSSMGEQSRLNDLQNAGDNVFLPIPNFRQLVEKGGLEAIFAAVPIDKMKEVVVDLQLRQQELKQIIYEVTGISDIIRGSTKASETLGAQQLKAQYGNLRISTRQSRFQQFIRDLLYIKAEIIAEHFEPQTLQLMTGINVIPDQAYEMAKQQGSLEAGAVSETTFAQACDVLRSDKLRGFKVSIQTDSTVPLDREKEREERSTLIQSVGGYLQQVMPAIQQGVLPPNVAREMLLFVVRGFKVSGELEDVMEEIGASMTAENMAKQMQQMQQQLQQAQEQLQKGQQENQQLQEENVKLQHKQQADMQAAAQKSQIEAVNAQHTRQLEQVKADQETQIKARDAQQEQLQKERDAEQDRRLKELEAAQERRLTEMQAAVDRMVAAQAAEQKLKEQKAAAKEKKNGEDKADSSAHLKAISDLTKHLTESAGKTVRRKGTAKLSGGKTIQLDIEETRH